MEDQKNFVMAMVLSLFVLLFWAFFAKPNADELREQAAIEQALEADPSLAPVVVAPKDRDELVATGVRIPIDTESLSGSFSVTGSRFDDLRLKNYQATLEPDSGTVIMFTPEGADKSAYVYDNWTRTVGSTGANMAWSVKAGSRLTETTPVVLEYSGEGYAVERTISVDNRYLITLDDKVTNTSNSEITLVRKGMSRQHGLPDDLTNFFILQEGPIAVVDNDDVKMKYKKLAKKKALVATGESGWAGLTDKYWLAAAIAPQGKQMSAKFNFRTINEQDVYEAGYELDPTTLTPGSTISSKGYIYGGAKDRGVLEGYEKDLGISQMDLAIDWGFLSILVRPMSGALTVFGKWLGNYGLGIMLLTLLIKIVLFPLFNKQYASQAKMKLVQPKVKKIQELYKGDRMKMQQEMMAIYKKEGVNPAAGCLPVIPTIFVFFALYKSVFINIDLRHEPFFGWIRDLSAKDPLSILNGFGALPWDPVPIAFLAFFAIGPLAIMYAVSMAMMYSLTPPAGDPTQAKIFKMMPWIFMFILAPFATGLLVYWVWNNILSFFQQYYITRKFKVDTPVDKFWRKIRGIEEPVVDDDVEIIPPEKSGKNKPAKKK